MPEWCKITSGMKKPISSEVINLSVAMDYYDLLKGVSKPIHHVPVIQEII